MNHRTKIISAITGVAGAFITILLATLSPIIASWLVVPLAMMISIGIVGFVTLIEEEIL